MLTTFTDKFSTLLKYYRLRAGLTQVEVAVKADIGIRTYQRLESAEALPSIEVLFILSQILDFKFSEIFHFEDEMSSEYLVLDMSVGLLKQATQVAKVGGWKLNLRNNFLYWTGTTRQIHEVDEDFIPTLENAINFYKEGESRKLIQRTVAKCIEAGTPFMVELDLLTAKKNEIRVVACGQAELVDDKPIAIYGTFQDVTQNRKFEKTLKETIRELEEIQSLAGIGRWKLNLIDNQLEWSHSLFEIFEIDPNQFKASYEGFLDLVHPEDRNLVNEAYTNSLKTQKPYEARHRLLMKDGRVKWIQERCFTEFSKDGQPLISTGFALDITKYISK